MLLFNVKLSVCRKYYLDGSLLREIIYLQSLLSPLYRVIHHTLFICFQQLTETFQSCAISKVQVWEEWKKTGFKLKIVVWE